MRVGTDIEREDPSRANRPKLRITPEKSRPRKRGRAGVCRFPTDHGRGRGASSGMDTNFRKLLEQHLPELEQEVFVLLGELNEFYRTLPDNVRLESARRIVKLLLLGYDDPKSELLYRAVMGLIAQRHQQGVSLREALTVVALPRRAISKVIRANHPALDFFDELDRVTQTVEELSVTVIDVYEQRTAAAVEERLAAERRYRLLYDRAPIMMHSIDAQGRLIEVNEKWEEVLGYSRNEALGRRSIEFMTEESRQKAIDVNIPSMMKTGYVRDIHYQFIKKNQEMVDVLISAIVVRNAEGEIDRILGVLLDVTDRLKAERALQESEVQYRSIVERSPLGICIHREGTIVYANGAMQQLVGVTSTDMLVGKDLLAFTHPDCHDSTLAQIHDAAQSTEAAPAIENRLLRVSGDTVEVDVYHQWVTYEGLPALQFVYLDISARKRAEEALRRAAASESTLATQDEIIRALSCPLIPFGKGALLMPLIGEINHGRATRIVEELARGVVEQQATIAILDVTGVPNVDAEVADALLRAASVVRLLGADVMLTGIQPGIARVIVELGIDMSGFMVKSSLRDGLSTLMRNKEWRRNN
jgi:rsbT co-antagonist protein RsbR